MTTLLYGGKPHADVEPGNRADAPAPAGPVPPFPPSPSFNPSTEATERAGLEATNATVLEATEATGQAEGPASAGPLPAPPSPMDPAPSPWLGSRTPGLSAMVLGIAAAATIIAGMAIVGVALAWHRTMTRPAEVALLILGGYLISLGVAYVVSVSPDAPRRHHTHAVS